MGLAQRLLWVPAAYRLNSKLSIAALSIQFESHLSRALPA
jgi:hypothetical protein